MKNGILRSVALGAAAVVLTGLCSACSVDIAPLFFEYEDADKYQTGNFTYAAADVTEIEIDWMAGAINVVQVDAETLSVSEKNLAKVEEARLHYYLDDSVLRIKFCESSFKGTIHERDKNLTVEIPAGVYLDIDTVSSPVEMGDVRLSGLSVSNVSGKVEIGALQANTVNIEMVSGNIVTGDISATALNIESVSGNIETSIVSAMTADIENTSGNVTVELKENLGTTLKLSMVSGRLSTDLEYTQSGSRFLFYGGGSNNVRVDLISGNLTVK